MTEIKMPFLKRSEEPMLDRTKTQTARTKRYGHKGDTFLAFGARFVLTFEPFLDSLAKIADEWKTEGCISYGDFLAVWKQIHPQRLVDFDERFWVHRFRKLDSDGDVSTFLGIPLKIDPTLPPGTARLESPNGHSIIIENLGAENGRL